MNSPSPADPPSAEPVLVLRALAKSYGATRALAGADLQVAAGEIVALMGANGAGKSTLVKILCGLHQADSGSIELRGKVVAPRSPAEARALGIIAVHQSIADVGVPGLSVSDNLLLDRYCVGETPLLVGRRTARRAAREIAAGIGLELDLDRRLEALSIAERQLVAIARAVACAPAVLLFDEPTASLSAGEAERLFRVIETLRDRGVAILYISHKTADLRRLADRTLVLRDGRIAAVYRRPIDFRAAIHTMVGHDVDSVARRRQPVGGQPILTITGARLRRSERPFDLTVHRGEVVAVTGPVGAGKTSLAGAIFGLWPLTGGSMTLDGRPWRPRGPAQSISEGVFYAGEDRWRTSFFPASVPFASIAGIVSFPFLTAWSRGGIVRQRREDEAARDALRTFGIKARGPRDPLTALSGGNQQKVVLARWHAEPARLLLLDEPFQGVDIGARDDIIGAIRARSTDRATLVFVNDLEEALEVGDRVIVMNDHSLADAAAADRQAAIAAI